MKVRVTPQDVLRQLIPYDPDTRALRDGQVIGIGVGAQDFGDLVGTLKTLGVTLLSKSEIDICRELGELIRYRLIFLMLPADCLYANPREDKPIIREHLKNLGISPDEDLVRGVKFVCENFRKKRGASIRKWGVTDVYLYLPHIYQAKLESQGGRCNVCGTVLHYGENMQLDHVMPWHLGNDPVDGSNWQFLCLDCNTGKNVFPYFSLSKAGINWIGPEDNDNLRLDVRYAALVRDGKCVRTGRTPRETELVVTKRVRTGCWILDNVESTCLIC